MDSIRIRAVNNGVVVSILPEASEIMISEEFIYNKIEDMQGFISNFFFDAFNRDDEIKGAEDDE